MRLRSGPAGQGTPGVVKRGPDSADGAGATIRVTSVGNGNDSVADRHAGARVKMRPSRRRCGEAE